jgi:uncharacterized phage protein gp47/JayE
VNGAPASSAGHRDTIVCGAGRDTAFADKLDRLKGCEKVTRAKPGSAAAKRKRKKSSRSRR